MPTVSDDIARCFGITSQVKTRKHEYPFSLHNIEHPKRKASQHCSPGILVDALIKRRCCGDVCFDTCNLIQKSDAQPYAFGLISTE